MALAAAGILAGAGAIGRRRARRAEREDPPTGQFLDLDGIRLHYLDRGQGPPVLFLHGNGAMAEDWRISGVLAGAAARYRAVAIDRPGFGYSDRPRSTVWTAANQAALLRRALRRLGIERPIVVGHSWGTLAALALALEEPRAVRGLVLLSGYYFPTARGDVPVLVWPAVPILGDVMRYTLSPLLGRLLAPKIFRKMFAPSRVPARFAAEFPTALALRPWQIRASAADTALMIPAAQSLHGRYGELTMPVAIMAGDGDRIVDVGRHAERLHRTLPDSALTIVPGVGHMVHYAAPRQVVEAIALVERHSQVARGGAAHWPLDAAAPSAAEPAIVVRPRDHA